jgi:hypothetical protein
LRPEASHGSQEDQNFPAIHLNLLRPKQKTVAAAKKDSQKTPKKLRSAVIDEENMAIPKI